MTTRDIRDELAGLTVIYRMLECGDRIPIYADGTDYVFLEPILEKMLAEGLIEVDGDVWAPTRKGVALRDRMATVHDQLLQFEIFGSVNLNQGLGPDLSPNGEHVFDHVYDPRFVDPEDPVKREELNTQDLRIAMVAFLRAEMSDVLVVDPEAFDPRRLVFLRMLADGALRGDIWFDLRLGKPFDLVDEIVETAYRWDDLIGRDPSAKAPPSPEVLAQMRENAKAMMRSIYTAGMLERRKRAGDECGKCGVPLALFEQDAKLDRCPNPDCGADLSDRRIAVRQDQIVEEEVVEEVVEERWVTCCEPYGWYDPYNPFVDAAAFALLCAVLW